MTGKDKIPVIGIAGGSCSGKSSIAAAFASMLKGRGVGAAPKEGSEGRGVDGGGAEKRGGAAILSLDSYYVDLAHLPLEERSRRNFDAPEAIDIELAARHLRALASGGAVLAPVYRFGDHTRAPESEWIRLAAGGIGALGGTCAGGAGGSDGTGVAGAGTGRGGTGNGAVIVEGLFALYFPSLRSMFDLSIFVDAGHDTCLARRLKRDVAERGRTRDDVVEQYGKTVRPMYERHVAPTRAFADMTVDGEAGVGPAAASILKRLVDLGLC